MTEILLIIVFLAGIVIGAIIGVIAGCMLAMDKAKDD